MFDVTAELELSQGFGMPQKVVSRLVPAACIKHRFCSAAIVTCFCEIPHPWASQARQCSLPGAWPSCSDCPRRACDHPWTPLMPNAAAQSLSSRLPPRRWSSRSCSANSISTNGRTGLSGITGNGGPSSPGVAGRLGGCAMTLEASRSARSRITSATRNGAHVPPKTERSSEAPRRREEMRVFRRCHGQPRSMDFESHRS